MDDRERRRRPGAFRSTSPADRDRILLTGTRVLRAEAEGLLKLAAHLSYRFVDAVETFGAARGRIITSGIGKSGHIARKIAATLASTGTPAQFVHPAEASHGDLGMITADDVCLVISNSGETAELSDVVAHTRRFSIPLVAITSRPQSALVSAADVVLLLADAPEACSIGMAPTTSTTMALALGDALAVALMEKRGFGSADFGVFHPGGKLGAQLVTVGRLMHTGDSLPLVEAGTAMPDVLLVMTAKSFGVVGVVGGDGRLTGIITDGDLRRHMAGLMAMTAAGVMHPDPVTIRAEELAARALGVMNERKITCLFVIDGERMPVGLLHIHDCLRAGIL
jgi:arabinose-5-phosphate isomerase